MRNGAKYSPIARVLSALSVITLLGSAVACTGGSGREARENGTFNLALPYAQGINRVALEIGVEDGVFKKHGLKPKLQTYQGGGAVIQAFGAGEAQFGHLGTLDLLNAVKNGLPIVAAMNIVDRGNQSLIVKKTSPIEQLDDLRGGTIAVTSKGSLTDAEARYWVGKSGLDPESDAKIVGAGDIAAAVAAVRSGKADAGVSIEPITSAAVAKGDVRVIAGMDDEQGFGAELLAASKDVVEDDPDFACRVVKGYVDSYKYAAEHESRVVGKIMKDFDVSKKVAEKTFNDWIKSHPFQ